MLHRVFILALSLAVPLAGSCNPRGDSVPDDSPDDGGIDPHLGGGRCVSLGCRVAHCTPVTKTTLTGVVNIPAGNLPLYGARVYIPTTPLGPIEHGPSCDRCDQLISGDPLMMTTTDAAGKFTLEDVPSGADIPLVVQVGKWRRQLTIANVPSCTVTQINPDLTRLPRNQFEGDLPLIALTTGGADALECLVRKLGLDDYEITSPTGGGHVHLYSGAGGVTQFSAARGGDAIPPASPWWDYLDNLKQYDVILHSCEGIELSTNKSPAARLALKDYIDMGGRVFASHWHNFWVEQGVDPLPTVATFNHRQPPVSPLTADIDTSFAKGQALADWLVNVGGSQPPGGHLDLLDARNSVSAVNTMIARAWITYPPELSIQYVSFDAPIEAPADQQCGRMVLSDIHVSSDWLTAPFSPYPTGCMTTDLTAQEKALIFMLFDLSNCLAPVIG